MKDQELFDLCKQVYEATGWGLLIGNGQLASYRNDLRFFKNSNLGDEVTITNEPVYNIRFIEPIPLYTSDYLLDKLETLLVNSRHRVYHVQVAHTDSGKWRARYVGFKLEFADTPCKALLKLCLALDKEGLLS